MPIHTIMGGIDLALASIGVVMMRLGLLLLPLFMLQIYDRIIPHHASQSLMVLSMILVFLLLLAWALQHNISKILAHYGHIHATYVRFYDMAWLTQRADALVALLATAVLFMLAGWLALLPVLTGAIMLWLSRHPPILPTQAGFVTQADALIQNGWQLRLRGNIATHIQRYVHASANWLHHMLRYNARLSAASLAQQLLPMLTLLIVVYGLSIQMMAAELSFGAMAACILLAVRMMAGFSGLKPAAKLYTAPLAPTHTQTPTAASLRLHMPDQLGPNQPAASQPMHIAVKKGEIEFLPLPYMEARTLLEAALDPHRPAQLFVAQQALRIADPAAFTQLVIADACQPLQGHSVLDALSLGGKHHPQAVRQAIQDLGLNDAMAQLPNGLMSPVLSLKQLPEAVQQLLQILPAILWPARSYLLLLPTTILPPLLYQHWLSWLQKNLNGRTALLIGEDRNMALLAHKTV